MKIVPGSCARDAGGQHAGPDSVQLDREERRTRTVTLDPLLDRAEPAR